MKTLKIEQINITEDKTILDKENHITPYVSTLIEKLYYELPKERENTLNKLLKYTKQFPKVPIFKNYLAIYYRNKENFKKVVAINKLITKEHPNYLYGKLNAVEDLIDRSDTDINEEVEKFLGTSLLLHELYPERNQFLPDEIFSFYAITIKYLFHIDENDEAENRISVLEELMPNYHKIDILGGIRINNNLIKGAKRFEEAEQKRINVPNKDRRSHLQIIKPPKFNHPNHIQFLYENNFEDIDTGILEDIVSLDKTSLVADLIAALKDSIYRYDYFEEEVFDENSTYFPIHAILLLTYLQDDLALDTVLEILRQDKDFIEFWYGYESSEYMVPYIAGISKNIDDKLISFLKEENVHALNKSEILSAIFQRNTNGSISKQKLDENLNELLDFLLNNTYNLNLLDSEFNGFIIADLMNYGVEPFLQKVKSFFDLEIVDVIICGTYNDVLKSIKEKKHLKKADKKYDSITEFYKDKFGLNSDFDSHEDFNEQNIFDNYLKKDNLYMNKNSDLPIIKKVGRNEPCPCNSGKKYKKCCINL